jgi:hypothetical protein
MGSGDASVFSLSGSLSSSSQVSRGALGLLRYDGSGRVYRGHPEVLVSSSLSPWRHELLVVQQMRRLSALRRELSVVRLPFHSTQTTGSKFSRKVLWTSIRN